MVSIPDFSRWSRLVQDPVEETTQQKYERHRQNEVIRFATENGYLVKITQAFLVTNFYDPGPKKERTANDIREITCVQLSRGHLRSLGAIEFCQRLTFLSVANNYITNIDSLAGCILLKKLDLGANQIEYLPDHDFWASLRHLRVLYLHDNPIGRTEAIAGLSASPNLAILTLYNSPVSLKRNYRHHVVNSLWSLKALDRHVISDEEIIEDAHFPGPRFHPLDPVFKINAYRVAPKGATVREEMSIFAQLLGDVTRILAHNSPVIIIQRYMRGHMARKRVRVEQQIRAINLEKAKRDLARNLSKPLTPPKEQDVKPATPPKDQDVKPSTPPKDQDIKPSTPPKEQDVKPSTPLNEQDVKPSTPPKEDDAKPSTPPKEETGKLSTPAKEQDEIPLTNEGDIKPTTSPINEDLNSTMAQKEDIEKAPLLLNDQPNSGTPDVVQLPGQSAEEVDKVELVGGQDLSLPVDDRPSSVTPGDALDQQVTQKSIDLEKEDVFINDGNQGPAVRRVGSASSALRNESQFGDLITPGPNLIGPETSIVTGAEVPANQRKVLHIDLHKLHGDTSRLEALDAEARELDMAISSAQRISTGASMRREGWSRGDGMPVGPSVSPRSTLVGDAIATSRRKLASFASRYHKLGDVRARDSYRSLDSDRDEDDEQIPRRDFRLCGRAAGIQEVDPVVEMILRRAEVGRMIREAEGYYHRMKLIEPPPHLTEKQKRITKPGQTNDQRLFTRTQGTMGVLMLQKWDRIDRDLRLHDRSLRGAETVSQARDIKREARQNVSLWQADQRQNNQIRRRQERRDITRAIQKNKEAERMDLERRQWKRQRQNQLKAGSKEGVQFATEFRGQHNAVSKALLKHDRHALSEDKRYVNSHFVKVCRETQREQMSAIKRYLQHQSELRQTQVAQERANLDAKVLADTNQRLLEAHARVDHIKALRRQTQELPPVISRLPAPDVVDTDRELYYEAYLERYNPEMLLTSGREYGT